MFTEYFTQTRGKPLKNAPPKEIFYALTDFVKEQIKSKGVIDGKKRLYYISAEFLTGKLLSNNLINSGLFDTVNSELAAAGTSVAPLEDLENEPSLGNGGLGRLAACFLDSLATLNLPASGIGINYRLGLFRQKFKNLSQHETPDSWIEENSWLNKTDRRFKVQFKNLELDATEYYIDVVGYGGKSDRLYLYDCETVNEKIVQTGITFDKTNIEKNISLFIYPDDSDENGKLLRLYQEYFMVSCGAQHILDEAKEKGSNLKDLADFAAVQINDTHPTLIIPELIYLLENEGLPFDEAVKTVTDVCSYTNHTILAEALEKWPLEQLNRVTPHLVPVIKKLDEKIKAEFKDESVYIIDKNQLVHMAAIDIHFSHSVNGVAKLHTDILKNSELKNFSDIYPKKFNNKTNGITFRRWLMGCNPDLCGFIEELIGNGFKKDAYELKKLLDFKNDEAVLSRIGEIKHKNKVRLVKYLSREKGVILDENAIFDIQIKRLHEYKRQQLNMLYIISKYLDIKSGKIPNRPLTFIFGAKAAPSYIAAKDIIHLILCMEKITAKECADALRVVMVENYNVTYAEKLVPACDLSEQISLASKEASGTGNMKLMLNGAVTIGTMDGANVEIANLVGEDNIYIFGRTSDEVIATYKAGNYRPAEVIKNNPKLKGVLDFIVSEKMLKTGNAEKLLRLHKELTTRDYFMALPDFEDYMRVKNKAFFDYENRTEWNRKSLFNIANAGYFSSDKTIEEYNSEIWHLKKDS